MHKIGKIEIQPALVAHGFVSEEELRRLKKFLKVVATPHYKGSRTHGTGDVYNLARVLSAAGDMIESGVQIIAADALPIVKRLASELQYIEV